MKRRQNETDSLSMLFSMKFDSTYNLYFSILSVDNNELYNSHEQ